MTTLDKTSLLAQLAELDKQKEEIDAQKAAMNEQLRLLKLAEKQEVVDSIKAKIAEYGLTADDIFFAAPAPNKAKSRKATGPAPAKYKDPESGKTWSGRGLAPLWIKDKNRDEFLIKE